MYENVGGLETSEQITQLVSALAVFQDKVGTIKKGDTNPFLKNAYASLPTILNGIKEPLKEASLVISQFPIGTDELMTQIIHTPSGEYMRASYKMTPTKNDPQGKGSAITYQRRYALGAILNLNIDEDDDGNDASKGKVRAAVKTGTKAAEEAGDILG